MPDFNHVKVTDALEDLYQEMRSGLFTIEHLGWFMGLSKEQRDNLASLGVPDVGQEFVLKKATAEKRQNMFPITPESFVPHPRWREEEY